MRKIIFLFLMAFFLITLVKAQYLVKTSEGVVINYETLSSITSGDFQSICNELLEKYNIYFNCYATKIIINNYVDENTLNKIRADTELQGLHKSFNVQAFADFIQNFVNYIIRDSNIWNIRINLDEDYNIINGYIEVGNSLSYLTYLGISVEGENLRYLSNSEVEFDDGKVVFELHPNGYLDIGKTRIKNVGKDSIIVQNADEGFFKRIFDIFKRFFSMKTIRNILEIRVNSGDKFYIWDEKTRISLFGIDEKIEIIANNDGSILLNEKNGDRLVCLNNVNSEVNIISNNKIIRNFNINPKKTQTDCVNIINGEIVSLSKVGNNYEIFKKIYVLGGKPYINLRNLSLFLPNTTKGDLTIEKKYVRIGSGRTKIVREPYVESLEDELRGLA